MNTPVTYAHACYSVSRTLKIIQEPHCRQVSRSTKHDEDVRASVCLCVRAHYVFEICRQQILNDLTTRK